jgi:hypothetical protein
MKNHSQLLSFDGTKNNLVAYQSLRKPKSVFNSLINASNCIIDKYNGAKVIVSVNKIAQIDLIKSGMGAITGKLYINGTKISEYNSDPVYVAGMVDADLSNYGGLL